MDKETFDEVFEGGPAARPPAQGDGKSKAIDLAFVVFGQGAVLGTDESVDQTLHDALLRPLREPTAADTLGLFTSAGPSGSNHVGFFHDPDDEVSGAWW